MKPDRIVTLEGIFVLDDSGFYEPLIEPDPKLPRWQNGALWFGGGLLCLGTLYLAGQCLSMAWGALPA